MNLKFKHLFRNYSFYTFFLTSIIFIIVGLIDYLFRSPNTTTHYLAYGVLAIGIIDLILAFGQMVKLKGFVRANSENQTTAVVARKAKVNKSYLLYLKYSIGGEEYTSTVRVPNLSKLSQISENDEVSIIYDPASKKVFLTEGMELNENHL